MIPTQSRTVMSVSQLNRATGQLLGEHFFSVMVAGELSNTTDKTWIKAYRNHF